MSILAEKLNELLTIKQIAPYQSAQNCPFENATLYQYLNGKRPLKKKDHLDIIISLLKLTPQETEQVLEAYKIEKIGIALYRQRQKTADVLNSLQTIHTPSSMFNSELPNDACFDFPNSNTVKVITCELEIYRAAFAMIYNAFCSKQGVKLFLPLELETLLHAFIVLGNTEFSCPFPQVTHVICLESDATTGSISNLESLQRILKYGIAIPTYQPMYFYGRSSEHFSSTNLLPGLILTDQAALQISADGNYALLHTQPKSLVLFHNFFEQLCSKCRPLMANDITIANGAEYAIQQMKKSSSKNIYEITSGICSIQFWNRQLLEAYLNPRLPNYDHILKYYVSYSQQLYEVKRQKGITIFMKPHFVLDFIQTGFFREYPSSFFAKPLSIEDRKELLNCLLSAIEEGWYKIYFIEDEYFPLNHRWELGVVKGFYSLFQYFQKDRFYVFPIEELGIVDAFSDYLESLTTGSHTMSLKDSEMLLRQWIHTYL